MNDLQIFENKEFGKVRTLMIDNEPWFIASDIAKSLGYRMASDLTRRLDDDDKGTHKMSTPSGEQEMSIINESGLYSSILGSNLPNAKKFKHWVTADVLPSIRKNGGYISNQEQLTPEQIVANALIVAQNIIADRDKQIEAMKPKADYFDALVDRNLNTNIRDTAKELGIAQNQFVMFLMDNGYIYRDLKGKIKPYAEKNKGLFVLKEYCSPYNSTHAGLQTLITPKGRETFRLLLMGE